MVNHMVELVRRALASEARAVAIEYAAGVLTLDGEVPSVAAKKLALERAAAVPGVDGIVDRLRVVPAERMGDGRIADLLRDALLQEPAFADFSVRGAVAGRPIEAIRSPAAARGSLEFSVGDGVVTLDGQVPGLDDKRLAGVLAWWIPGSRDVVNGIAVEPDEEDGDDKITEAVRLVLEKDPFVAAGQIRVSVVDAVVFLDGSLASEAERDMAESDAWFVFAVDRVVNRIEVHR